MRIHTRISLGFMLLFTIGFLFFTRWFINDIKVQTSKTMEESLVDISQILASAVEEITEGSQPDINFTEKIMQKAFAKTFNARIYEMNKTKVNLRVLITDNAGIVLYDSNGLDTGKDFSSKNDIYLTLKGKYGARSTRTKKDDPLTSHYYVAAPVYINGAIVGVVSVSKPASSVNVFIKHAREKIITTALVSFFIIIVFGYLLALWIVIPLNRLTRFAEKVKRGDKTLPPEGGSVEVKKLNQAFKKMKQELEAREYIESYIQKLTHELKSPLSALIGASELLEEDMDPDSRRLFVSNIKNESNRIQALVHKMLSFASLENKNTLENIAIIDVKALIGKILTSGNIQKHTQRVVFSMKSFKDNINIKGEELLLFQAFENIMQNAMDFSPDQSVVEISVTEREGTAVVTISDSGPGIPEYAEEKVFDKFFSLPRPHTGKKSTGLGLCFVKEIIDLHGGRIILKNNEEKGLLVTVELPLVAL